MGTLEELDLNDLLETWKRTCRDINPQLIQPLHYEEITIEDPRWDGSNNEFIDWWPNDELTSNRKIIEEKGVDGLNKIGKRFQGTLDTANLLMEFRNEPEKLALVWIAASMFEKLKHFPKSWYGEMPNKVENLFGKVVNGLGYGKGDIWSHRTRDILPVALNNNWYFHEILTPTKYKHLISIAALESSLSYSNWTIVKIKAKN